MGLRHGWAGALCASLAFAFSSAASDFGGDAGVSPGPAPAWQDKLQSLLADKTIRDPDEQCVPVAQMHLAADSPVKDRAIEMLDILDRTEMTGNLHREMHRAEAVLCFMDFDKEYGLTSLSFAGAVLYKENDAIAINTSPRIDKECHATLLIHEAHHMAQKNAGVLRGHDLVRDDMRKYLLETEADAHVVQIIGSWMLANPDHSSRVDGGAESCFMAHAQSTPYKLSAYRMLEDIARDHPDWITNGQAARQIHKHIYEHRDFQANYLFGLGYLYNCDDNESCMQELHTLDDLGIDFSHLGTIHYQEDYRQIPLLPYPAP